MNKELTQLSKFISLVLRHKPEEIGIVLDKNGWADTDELIARVNQKDGRLTMAILEEIVETNEKKRFAFNEDKSRIRASQGHSIEVELGLEPVQPPDILYHGTADSNLNSILEKGLQKQNRQHVHLSATSDIARQVGTRHGKPVVLQIDTAAMFRDGFLFYCSANKVWLTDSIPVTYITL